MSKEWFAAADAMIAKQLEEVDIVVSTALVQGPAGRKAPPLIKDYMVAGMKRGSIAVDLAAEAPTIGQEGAFGNIAGTKPGESYVTDSGVTMIGYSDLPGRLPTTSSNLYANNQSKFLLSVGPMTTKEKGYYHIDRADEAVKGMLVLEKGALHWPPAPPPAPAPAAAVEEVCRRRCRGRGRRSSRADGGSFLFRDERAAPTAVLFSPVFFSWRTTTPNPYRLRTPRRDLVSSPRLPQVIEEVVIPETEAEMVARVRNEYLSAALRTTAASGTLLTLGAVAPNAAFAGMLSTVTRETHTEEQKKPPRSIHDGVVWSWF